MVTAIDHNAIKTRIVDELKNDSTLWNATSIGLSDTFRSLEVGTPDARKINELNHPACFVTSSEIIEDTVQVGSTVGDEDKATEHIIRYLIVFTEDQKDGRKAEVQLDARGKKIAEVLRANKHLGTPGTPTTNRLVQEIWPEQLAILNRDLAGSSVQGRVWRVKVKAYTG
jgi:hypothetical protein